MNRLDSASRAQSPPGPGPPSRAQRAALLVPMSRLSPARRKVRPSLHHGSSSSRLMATAAMAPLASKTGSRRESVRRDEVMRHAQKVAMADHAPPPLSAPRASGPAPSLRVNTRTGASTLLSNLANPCAHLSPSPLSPLLHLSPTRVIILLDTAAVLFIDLL